MDKAVKKYMSEIGMKGGRKSRRVLDPETARKMVLIRDARRAFKKYYIQCFWSFKPDYRITAEDIPWVADQLMKHGDRDAWFWGHKLCR